MLPSGQCECRGGHPCCTRGEGGTREQSKGMKVILIQGEERYSHLLMDSSHIPWQPSTMSSGSPDSILACMKAAIIWRRLDMVMGWS